MAAIVADAFILFVHLVGYHIHFIYNLCHLSIHQW